MLASQGYPEKHSKGIEIFGINSFKNKENLKVYHAGTKKNSEGHYVTNGGRVLAVVGRGDTRESAIEHSYKEAEKINFDGNQRRSDIGRMHF